MNSMLTEYNKEIRKELYEKLAEIEHQRWADWQKWCHKVLRENCSSPELEKVLERWDKQIATPYKDLTEKEKDSDREQVDRYWYLIESQNERLLKRVRERVDMQIIEDVIKATPVWVEQIKKRETSVCPWCGIQPKNMERLAKALQDILKVLKEK